MAEWLTFNQNVAGSSPAGGTTLLVGEEVSTMQNMIVARYAPDSVAGYSGYIEPEDRGWIVFLGEDGKPACYWPTRDETGAVVGEAVQL